MFKNLNRWTTISMVGLILALVLPWSIGEPLNQEPVGVLTASAKEPTIQVCIDSNGDAIEPNVTYEPLLAGRPEYVDYAIVGVLSVNSPDAPPAPYIPSVSVNLAQLGLRYVETVYLATHSSFAFDLPDDVKVATFVCEYAEGGPPTKLHLIMGVNTAEWAVMNPCIREVYGEPRHSLGTILDIGSTSVNCDREYDAYTYLTSVHLDPSRTLSSMRLELVDANLLAGYRIPQNSEPTWLGQANMAITLAGPAITEPGVSGGFRIVDVDYPSTVISGGGAGPLSVYWEGEPVFPVTVVYRPVEDGCPPGADCTSPTMVFEEEANPLFFPEAVWCYGFSETVYFGYEVVLIDATDRESEPFPASFTCQVGTADFRITRVDAPSPVISNAPPGDVTVWWTGDPTFPVTVIARPTEHGCAPGVRCYTETRVFDESQNPLVMVGASWCENMPQDTWFGYEVVLVDANEQESTPFPIGAWCIPK